MTKHLSKEEFAAQYRGWRGELARRVENTISAWPVTLMEVCDDRSCLFSVMPAPWMANPGGVMHGGIVCTLLDTAMGSVAGGTVQRMTPTVSMNVNFVRPVALDKPVYIRVHAPGIGGTLAYMTGALWQETEDRPCATASGTYFTK